MVKGIEHAAIAASNAQALADWYVSVLGFSINYKSANAIFVRAQDGSMIEIIHADADRAPQTMKTQGLRHLALAVTDFDSVYSGIRDKGVTFLTEPQESKGTKVVFFQDPEGNYLHLIERGTPLPERP
jgi:glyoxylase I family protein